MGEHNFAQVPVAIYGVVLWLSGLAYYILTRVLVNLHGKDSLIDTVLRNKFKETISLVAYALAIVLAFVNTAFSLALYAVVAFLWLIPDTRVEMALEAAAREQNETIVLFS
jgi:uncharacterized membrane protein